MQITQIENTDINITDLHRLKKYRLHRLNMENFIYKEEGYKIIGCFYAVYNTLGPGFLEAVYQEALEKEFIKNNIPYVREKKVDVFYNDEKLKKYYKPDLKNTDYTDWKHRLHRLRKERFTQIRKIIIT